MNGKFGATKLGREVKKSVRSIRYIFFVVLGIILIVGTGIHPISAAETPIVSRGETFTLSATLLTNGTSGTPLSYQEVYFFDQTYNELMGVSITNSEGIASIDYAFAVSHPLGLTIINVTFSGNEPLALAPTCQWLSLIVTSSTSITLDVPKTVYAPNDYLSFQIHLFDDSGGFVNNADISIFCNSIHISNITTNSTGYAQANILLDKTNFSLGQNSIEVVFDGDSNRFFRGSSNQFEIEIQQMETRINLENISSSLVMLNETWTIKLHATSDDATLSIQDIDISLDNSYLDTISTNSNGYCEISLLINQSFTIGEHIFTFEYQGNTRYKSSTIDVLINIGSPISLNVTPIETAEIGKDAKLRISVLDIFNRSLPNAVVNIFDSTTEKWVNTTISDQAIVDIDFEISGERGTRNLLISVSNGLLLTNNTIYMSLDVFTRPYFEITNTNILGYASPSQPILINALLKDYRGSLSNRNLSMVLSNTFQGFDLFTDTNGIVEIEFSSPEIEGQYYLYVQFEGNISDYELPCQFEYSFIVSRSIPVEVALEEYEVIAPLSTIHVTLRLQSLNGSHPDGIPIEYHWHSIDGLSLSQVGGYIDIHIPIPNNPGIHMLLYEVGEREGIEPISGIFYIIITSVDSNATEGIGLYGIIIGFTGSLGIFAVPLVRRRYIVD